MPILLQATLLLICSNVFMTFAGGCDPRRRAGHDGIHLRGQRWDCGSRMPRGIHAIIL